VIQSEQAALPERDIDMLPNPTGPTIALGRAPQRVSGIATLAVIGAIAGAAAADPPPAPDLPTIVVTATRVAQPSFDLPIAVDSVGQDAIRAGQLQVNLSESLGRVPGIVVQNRQNYAQDLQISSRGFGARSTFGVRGIRLFVDGIPASQPDGQGQVSNFDLGSAQRIEVMRGPFSALYGNASGGVIAIFTEDGKPGTALDMTAIYSSDDTQRYQLKLSGEQDGFNYVADIAQFHTGGARDHSRADRPNFNAKLRYSFDDGSRLTFLANAVDVWAEDPLGLTRAQYDANPRQAGINAVAFNTRKSVDQEQFGLVYTRDLGDHDALSAMVYGGNRGVVQFQAIPVATQTPPSSPGGVIDLAIGYVGTDLHLTDRRTIAGMKLQVTVGVTYDDLDEVRQGYQNFIGQNFIGRTLGVRGALRRNENDAVAELDPYLQAQLEPDERWLIEAGVRNSRVKVTSHDHYIVPGNGDDSGNVTYRATTPAAGVTYRAAPDLNLYVSYGQGFETPTLNELAYRSTGGTVTGLNLGLRASRSDNYEIGVKSRLGDHFKLNAAAFHIETNGELVIQANTAGRSVYQNAGRTTRDGVEIGLNGALGGGFEVAAAYTYLRATYADRFTACPGLPCVPTVIPAGNRIPSIPLHAAYAELSWNDPSSGFSAALEGRYEGRVFVDDPNSDSAPAYFTANLRAGLEQAFGDWRLKEFVRVDNLADRKYAGSVIVNESNGRFFEPALGRSAYFGVSARYGW